MNTICSCTSCRGAALDETDFWYIRCGTVETVPYFQSVVDRYSDSTDKTDKEFADHYASVLRLKKLVSDQNKKEVKP